MLAKPKTFSLLGIDALPVEVEVIVWVMASLVMVLTADASEPSPYQVSWIRQFGGTGQDSGQGAGVAVSALGDVFVTGETYSSLFAQNAGSADIYLAKYDRDGTLIWGRQVGGSSADWSMDVTVDVAGDAFVVGGSYG